MLLYSKIKIYHFFKIINSCFWCTVSPNGSSFEMTLTLEEPRPANLTIIKYG